jgi:hypothetical protein
VNSNEETETLEAVRRALSGLQFGSVEITVHDSKVVQIDRKERVRLNSDSKKAERRPTK